MKFIDLRKKIGTQQELANLLNVKQQTVVFWENGESYPRMQNLKKMANLFCVSEMDIISAIENSRKI